MQSVVGSSSFTFSGGRTSRNSEVFSSFAFQYKMDEVTVVQTETTTTEDNDHKSELVTKLGVHDVLMGRGAAATDYQGNLRLRDLVAQRQDEYAMTERRSDKHRIAEEIIDTVHNNGGRFLQCADSLMDATTFRRLPRHAVVWKTVEDRALLANKVKQLLRDAAPTARARRKARRLMHSKRAKKRLEAQGGDAPGTKSPKQVSATSLETKTTLAITETAPPEPVQTVSYSQSSPAPTRSQAHQQKVVSSSDYESIERLAGALPAQILAQNMLPQNDPVREVFSLELLQRQTLGATPQASTSSSDSNTLTSALLQLIVTLLVANNGASAPAATPQPTNSLEEALVRFLSPQLSYPSNQAASTSLSLHRLHVSNAPSSYNSSAGRIAQAETQLRDLANLPLTALPSEVTSQIFIKALQESLQKE